MPALVERLPCLPGLLADEAAGMHLGFRFNLRITII
jgi:hypothetical protein